MSFDLPLGFNAKKRKWKVIFFPFRNNNQSLNSRPSALLTEQWNSFWNLDKSRDIQQTISNFSTYCKHASFFCYSYRQIHSMKQGDHLFVQGHFQKVSSYIWLICLLTIIHVLVTFNPGWHSLTFKHILILSWAQCNKKKNRGGGLIFLVPLN